MRPRRVAPRARADQRVSVTIGEKSAEGTLADISSSGALIEDCPLDPALGALVTLRPRLRAGGDEAVELRRPWVWIRAEVTRRTPSGGFGVSFQEVDEATADLFSRLAPRGHDAAAEPAPLPARAPSRAVAKSPRGAVMEIESLAEIVDRATREVFSLMLDTELRVGEHRRSTAPFERGDLSGFVAFTGGQVGFVAIHLSRDDAARFTAAFLALPKSEQPDPDAVRDAVGEITNMIAGTVKAGIGEGEPIQIGLPTVLDGAAEASVRVKVELALVVPFDHADGQLRVELVIQPAAR